MAYYTLRRANDQKTFTAWRATDERALFYFSILTGQELTFEGGGSPPYVLGKRVFAGQPVTSKAPVYRKDAALASAGK